MGAQQVVIDNILYIYCGSCEEGLKKQLTFDDMWAFNLNGGDWKVVLPRSERVE